MSLALKSLSQRKDGIISSRKRRLTQLWWATTLAAGAVDPVFRDVQPNADLAHFLDQNDIEKGRYFKESTLPRGPQHVFEVEQPQQRVTSAVSPSASSSKADHHSEGPRSSRSSVEASESNVDGHSSDVEDMGRPAKKAKRAGSDASAASTPNHDGSRRTRNAVKLSGVVIDEKPTPRKPSKSPAVDNNRVAASTTSKKPASPPYSPDGDDKRGHIRVRTDLPEEDVSNKVDVLTPKAERGSSFENDEASQPGKENINDSEPRRSKRKRNDDDDGQAEELTPVPEKISKVEPKGGHARQKSGVATAPRSPANEEDQARSRPAEASQHLSPEKKSPRLRAGASPSKAEDRQKSPLRKKDGTTPQPQASNRADVRSGETPVDGVESSRQNPVSMEGVAKPPSDQAKASYEQTDPADAIADSNETSGSTRAVHQQETVVSTSTTQHQLPASTESHRVSKPKTLRRRNAASTSVVMSKVTDQQFMRAMRLVKKDQPQRDGKAVGKNRHYFYFKFLRAAFDKAFPERSLPKLLGQSNKTIVTSDWASGIREEQDHRVLQRVEQLQDRNRWSLRQLKPSIEPPTPESHQDCVLRDLKWLATDFREERKFKVAIAKDLADMCYEWFNSSPEVRLSLQVKLRKELTIDEDTKMMADTVADRREVEQYQAGPVAKTRPDADLENDIGNDLSVKLEDEDTLVLPNPLADQQVLGKLPSFDSPLRSSHNTVSLIKHKIRSPQFSNAGQSRTTHAATVMDKANENDALLDESREPPQELPPQENFCALFYPESKPLRAKLNQPWAFKPPSAPLPPQAFYEHRNASHWTWEDDSQLRTFVKDFPSNWGLISDRMSPRTLFTSYADRRTPWECFERLLSMEGPPADAQARQYMRLFSYRLEQARGKFQAQQAAAQQHAQAQAQSAGQTANISQKRFPCPIRVERKVSRRFLAMLDSARKLARKRETNYNKLQTAQQSEAASQNRQNQPRTQPPHPPQYFSRMKAEKEAKEAERMHLYNQERAARAAQARAMQQQQGGQQTFTNGIAQQMRTGAGNVPGAVNGQVPTVPGQGKGPNQQAAMQMAMSNGMPPNSQVGVNARPQANMQGGQQGQRIAPQANGAGAENMQRMFQQIQQNRAMQMQNPQQQQAQYNSGSPNMSNANTVPNANMMGQFNNQMSSSSDGAHSPSVTQGGQNSTPSNPSPHMGTQSVATANSGGGQNQTPTHGGPHTLSSGHTPTISLLQHSIARQNPQMSQQEVQLLANEQLHKMMQRQRQNALNAAAGVHGQNLNMLNSMQNFANNQQQQQMYQQTQQSSGGSHQSPYQQNGLLSSNYQQGRSASPAGASPMLGTQQQQQQQNQYQAQLRQQMFNQRQQMGVGSPAPSNNAMSGMAGMNGTLGSNFNVNPGQNGTNPGMRPASRSSAGMDAQQQHFQQQQQQRPGSSASNSGMVVSPRPNSAQSGSGGQGQG